MSQILYWVHEIAFFVSGIIYAYTYKKKEQFWKRFTSFAVIYFTFVGIVNWLPLTSVLNLQIVIQLTCLMLLVFFQHSCWHMARTVAIYNSVWACMSWQLLYEICHGVRLFSVYISKDIRLDIGFTLFVFVVGLSIVAFTIAKWMPIGRPDKIGPRQFTLGIITFGIFEVIVLNIDIMKIEAGQWQILYLCLVILALVIYIQNELFKKSAIRQELEMMNLLWKKEQEHYQLSKENIALINQKCHDLKHQIRAIRNLNKDEMDSYLKEIESSIRIYESIVKTGNEVLDTILTEKSLYCEERNITVSCVADGSQMDFINTVDLYAILGNAMDNAIEAVEKLENKEECQIDVLIYRQQNFLVINIINPRKENLIYKEELPISTKGDARYHGFGLKSIRYLVKKYDGYVNISEADSCFSLKILIPIPVST